MKNRVANRITVSLFVLCALAVVVPIAVAILQNRRDAAENKKKLNMKVLEQPIPPTLEQIQKQAQAERSDAETAARLVMQGKLDQVRFYKPDAYYFPFARMDEFLSVRGAFIEAHTNLEFVSVVPLPDMVLFDGATRRPREVYAVSATFDYVAPRGYTEFVREKK